METRFIDYEFGDGIGEGFLAFDGAGKKPCVLIAHAWAGQHDIDREYAQKLAKMGFLGVAIDMFGKGIRGVPRADNSHLIEPLVSNRALLLSRVNAALKFAQGLENCDTSKMAIMGFCFGGMCALDLARSGTDEIRTAVSFHGLFYPNGLAPKEIKSKVLVLHGFDDPMATPEQTIELGRELNAGKADWQIHAFGQTSHAFTNPGANNPSAGLLFNEKSRDRAWALFESHLSEVFT